jgi:NhaP-type Na+/H+ or K+/H+ antiporter
VARRKSAELFMLNVLLITLGLAWLTELAGLSLALGAFTAGMLIGETEYRYQVEEDIKPFRDVLLGLFFVAIGMRLDLPQIAWNGRWWLGILLALMVSKLAHRRPGFAPVWQPRRGRRCAAAVALRRRRIRLCHPGAAASGPAAAPVCSRCSRPWCCRCCWRR